MTLRELLDETGLQYGQNPDVGLFVAFSGRGGERQFVTGRELENDILLFATELPHSEPASVVALRNLMRVADQGSLLKPMLVAGGQLILGIEIPSAVANPQIAEAAVRGLAFLADASPGYLEDRDGWKWRVDEWNQGLQNVLVETGGTPKLIPALAQERGWECHPLGDSDWLVRWSLGVPGGPSMAVGLRTRMISGLVSCSVLLEGARPEGDVAAYLRRLLEMSAEGSVAKVGLTEDDDIVILYQEPGVSAELMERLDRHMGFLLVTLLRSVTT